MNDTCTVCLATDKSLKTLNKSGVFGILKYLLAQKGYYKLLITNKICWDCIAQLDNVKKIQSKAFDSIRRLQEYCNQNEKVVTELCSNVNRDFNEDDEEPYEDISEIDHDDVNTIKTPIKVKKECGDDVFIEIDLGCSFNADPLSGVYSEGNHADAKWDDKVGDIDASKINDHRVVPYKQSVKEEQFQDTPQIWIKDFANVQQIDFANGEPTWRLQMLANEQLPTYGESKRRTCNDVTEKTLLSENESFACPSSKVNKNVEICNPIRLHTKKTAKPSKKVFKKKNTHRGEGSTKKRVKRFTTTEPLKCDLCIYKTFHKSDLIRHICTHTGEKPFKCHLCEYKAALKSSLKLHIRKHTGEKPYKCKLCDYKAIQNGDVRRHMSIHTGEKPYKCHICEYKTTQRCALKLHIRKHTGEKPFNCDLCDYKASRNSDLTIHMSTHTGEKPFKCHLCEYNTVKKNQLTNHIRTHTGEKPFNCHLCEYKAIEKGALTRHIRTHTGEKPFECHLCEYKATQTCDLKRHMYKHTRKTF